jgi:hypothetical protein
MLARAEADATHRTQKDLFGKMMGVMASSPDTSATLHGPVRLGSSPPSPVEVAGAGAAVPSASATVVAQPVGESSLKAGKPIDMKSSATNAGENADPKTQAGASNTKEENPSGIAMPTSKKKGRFHVLKKLKPF